MKDPLTIIEGDSVEKLRGLPAESVHCVVTSPPYDDLRTYGGNCKWDFEGTAREIFRVLVPGGVCCWNIADQVVDGSESLTSFRQALFFKDVVGFCHHDTMIWHKLNFSSHSFNRYHQCFEYIFILSKGKPRVFNPLVDKPNATAGRIGNLGVNTFMKRDGSRETRSKYVTAELGMRHNVWTGRTRGQEDMCQELPHPAMMPKWLARDLILSWSNPNDVILDPFAGSGTTGKMALEEGRKVILIEVDAKNIPIMRDSCSITPSLFHSAPSPLTAEFVEVVKVKAVDELESALWPEAKDIQASEGKIILKAHWREHPARAMNAVRLALENAVNQYEELRLIRAEALANAGTNNVTVGRLSKWAEDLRVKRESIAYHRRALIEVEKLIPTWQPSPAL